MRGLRNVVLLLVSMALASPASADFTVIAGWDRQLFPAYLIATASMKTSSDNANSTDLGDPNGLIRVSLEAQKNGELVKVTVTCEEFIETSEYSCTLAEAGKTYSISPKIRYRYDRLSKCRQATPATLTIRVQVGSSPAEETSTTVVFRSVNDCPLKVVCGDEVIDTTFAFAAFVNEQHPFVDKLLREALDIGVVDRFTGYQDKDNAAVLRQVYALWDLLVARDVRYSDITATTSNSDEVLSQHVRLIEETANNSQANCVDGSVMLVSMLRKIGIDAALVLEPGHCYVVFSADADHENMYGLETTLVDAIIDEEDELPEFLDEAVDEELRGEYSWPSFVAALGVATQRLSENTERYKNKESDYAIIDIATARKLGVLPIAFDAKEVFVAYDHLSDDDNSEEEEEEEEEEWSDEEDADEYEEEDADEDEDEE